MPAEGPRPARPLGLEPGAQNAAPRPPDAHAQQAPDAGAAELQPAPDAGSGSGPGDDLGWTGGQYSLGRALLAGALLLHFWAGALASSGLAAGLQAALALLSGCIALGFGGRPLVLGCAALLLGTNLSAGPTPLQFSLYALIALWLHAATPTAPFGSTAAWGRLDPAGDWRFPGWLGRAAWWLLAVECLWRAGAELADPLWRNGEALGRLLEGPAGRRFLAQRLAGVGPTWLLLLAWVATGLKLLFALAACTGFWRRGLWWALTLASLVALFFLEFTSEGLGRLLLLPFAFQPAWIAARRAAHAELVFYDGACGLCHRAVRFLLAEDRTGSALRFAPLRGPTFQAVVPPELQAALPDSLVLVTAEGEALDKSRALLHALARLGGLWRLLAIVGSAVPLALADPLYDAVARIRHRLFATPPEACPMLPPELLSRFDP
jgi:predicted DCC family thiol-disulfide oxidoreductase YuxK